MSSQYQFIGVDSLLCKNLSTTLKTLTNLSYLDLIMNFILDFLGYLFSYQLIVGLKLNGQHEVKHYVHEQILSIYVY